LTATDTTSLDELFRNDLGTPRVRPERLFAKKHPGSLRDELSPFSAFSA
jgi:hypothetical protein